MQIRATDQPLQQLDADVIVVGVYDDGSLDGGAQQFDRLSGGTLARLIENKEITGKANEVTPIVAAAGVAARQVVVVGLGAKEKLDAGRALRAAGTAARTVAARQRKTVAFALGDGWPAEWTQAAACGAIVACHGQDLYRSEKKLFPFEELLWCGGDADVLQTARILAEAVNLTRRLVNEPPSEIFPESFAARASDVAAETGLQIEVWDEHRLAAERCGSLLGVARGSAQPPRLVILRHAGGGEGQPWLALVGKGVTFDSGGLSLKPSDSMKTMKCDMAGAATVLGAMQAIARLGLPVNVMGLAGLVENMVSGDSYKVGDVLRARSGKTIEVLNTDAEGRLVLADVLNVAIERGAHKLVDLATLTGACMVALGTDVAGVMTNSQAWCDVVLDAAKTCGEPVWQLPMFEEYGELIKSDVADIKNVGEGRWGGAITAAKFLEEFVEGKPWVHLDIAGPAFLEKAKPWLDAGGSGAYVRTLVEVARRWNQVAS